MLYGHEKYRTMARSVLPSTRRRAAAQDLADTKRRYRRTSRQRLRVASHLAPNALIEDDFDLGLEQYPVGEIRSAVLNRRGADKVAPLCRWAVGATKELQIDDRLDWLRGVLPPNKIGRHALSHVVVLEEIRPRREHDWWWFKTVPKFDLEIIRRGLEETMERGGHTHVNRILKRLHAHPIDGREGLDSLAQAVWAEQPRWETDSPGALFVAMRNCLGLPDLSLGSNKHTRKEGTAARFGDMSVMQLWFAVRS